MLVVAVQFIMLMDHMVQSQMLIREFKWAAFATSALQALP